MAMTRMSGYDRALVQLRLMAVELALAVRRQLGAALGTLANPGLDVDWRQRDREIDALRDALAQRCFEIMSLRQLRDQDLRWILGYQRIAQELERVADYACDLAELSHLRPEGDWPCFIPEMAGRLVEMQDYIVAVLRQELETVSDLHAEDELLDRVFQHVREELIQSPAYKNKGDSLAVAFVLARTMERMGDHMVNVAEALVYIETGSRRLSIGAGWESQPQQGSSLGPS